MPQPNLVPVRPASSRIAQSSGICGSASRAVGFPLRVRLTGIVVPGGGDEQIVREGPAGAVAARANRHAARAMARHAVAAYHPAVSQPLVTPLPRNMIDAIEAAGVDLADAAREAGFDVARLESGVTFPERSEE